MPASLVDLVLEVCVIMQAKLKMAFGPSSHLVYKHRNKSKERKKKKGTLISFSYLGSLA